MATRKTTKTTPDDNLASATQAMADLTAMYQKMGMNAMAFMGGDWMERMSDMGTEMLEFYTQRVQADVELYHKLLHCKDLKEMHEIQGEFLQRMINRYSEETGKLIEMGKTAMDGGK
ncbi:phasin family protein [Aquicoccus sp. SU-CL01552]|uniref:phasin family protein n=1 Tax=Aquicoccus sp. SU-CL01552 TaxID=3127656 RepID=UPI0031098A89